MSNIVIRGGLSHSNIIRLKYNDMGYNPVCFADNR
jgi:hypothetical protein